MFDPTSRYYHLESATHEGADGESHSYVRRRFLPQGGALPLLSEVEVADGDRLDLVAARTIGAAEQYWRIADANNAMHPDALTADPGTRLRIPIPQVNQ